MSIFVAILFAVILIRFWKAALAVLAVAIIALLILGIASAARLHMVRSDASPARPCVRQPSSTCQWIAAATEHD